MAGLTEAGFEKKSLDEIKSELEDSFRSVFGPFINLRPGSVFATVIGIFADRVAEVWDVAEDVYNSQYPDTADGVSLDNVVSINGIERLAARESTCEGVLLFGTAATVVPAGTQFSVDGNPQAIFETDSQVELVDGVDAVQLISFSEVPDGGSFTLSYKTEETGSLTYLVTASQIESALNGLSLLSGVTVTGDFTAGFTLEFAGADGLQAQDLLVIDSSLTESASLITVTIETTQTGVPQGLVGVTAIETGPKAAPAGTLTVINTPVSGLTSVFNPESATIGRDEETDAELRLRRRESLSIGGNASLEAIRAKLLNVTDVREVIMFENTSNVTDGDNRPAKSFEAVVDGGDDDVLAETIWLAKPAGIETYGNTTIDIVDSQGDTRPISFSRAVLVPIFLSLDLTVDDDTFPETGVALVKTAILDWADTLAIGADVIVYPQLVSQLVSIPGILDVTIRVDDAAVSTLPGDPALDDNIIIAAGSRAEFSEPNLNVNVL